MEQTNLTTRKGCKSTSICLAPKRYTILLFLDGRWATSENIEMQSVAWRQLNVHLSDYYCTFGVRRKTYEMRRLHWHTRDKLCVVSIVHPEPSVYYPANAIGVSTHEMLYFECARREFKLTNSQAHKPHSRQMFCIIIIAHTHTHTRFESECCAWKLSTTMIQCNWHKRKFA